MESFLYTPIGFLFFELLRLYDRYKKKQARVFPTEIGYYGLMILMLLVVALIAHGIGIEPVTGALLLGFSLPNGIDKALSVISQKNIYEEDGTIDDLVPTKPGFLNRLSNVLLSRYFYV